MRRFLEKHALPCLVVVLAILLVAVIMAITLAWNNLGWVEFFISWLAIDGVGGFLLIKIVDIFEIVEIRKYQNANGNKQKKSAMMEKHNALKNKTT